MATTITQHPLYDTLPVGQEVMFTVGNTPIVSTFTGVKFIAEVHISDGTPPNPSTVNDVVGTFKTTPNNAGVGMFDFRPIIESFVNAQNKAYKWSAFKTIYSTYVPFGIHLIDKYARNTEVIRYLVVKFTTEYIDASGDLVVDGTQDNSDLYKVFNGYLKYTDEIILSGNNFGFNTEPFQLGGGVSGQRFLTNAPTTQYANIEDYGTLPFLTTPLSSNVAYTTLKQFRVNMYDSDGVPIGSTILIENLDTDGGFDVWSAHINRQMMFLGCFPANLRNWSSTFNSAIPTLSYYFVQAQNSTGQNISDRITININCPNQKGFESVRLTWLNQWGGWDYYTFKMKSSKTISTKGSTYQQLAGSWNEKSYRLDSFKGGKKSFRVNATEKITMNTDFVSESESEWFEELINSPEVYILEGFKEDATDSALNQYVIPVRLTTSNYTKKTVANDKLMQYTFEVEKSKTLRTQAI